MELTNDEKTFLKSLVEKELERFEAEEDTVIFKNPSFLASEEKYEDFMESLIKKLN